MPSAHTRGITLHYDTHGPEDGPAVVLVMGLATQMTAWRPGFCAQLASRGFRVVRFDNRDVGLSTKLHGAPRPSIPRALLMRRLGLMPSAPYTLSDMARDAVGLLDHLGIERAHVVGASMGGMIAQTMAIEHPSRVTSLVSIMSSTGDPRLPHPTAAARRMLLRPPARSREEAIEAYVEMFRVIGSPEHFDEARLREWAGESVDRSAYRGGVPRQLAAILASPDRTPMLARLRLATTVVHGTIDPLIPPAHGEATARAIPGAELTSIRGMAHDLPEPLWPRFIEAIERTAERAGR